MIYKIEKVTRGDGSRAYEVLVDGNLLETHTYPEHALERIQILTKDTIVTRECVYSLVT